MTPDELVAAARAWRDEDPDPGTRAELDGLLGAEADGADRTDGPDLAALRDRFEAGLEFGTAGLRGEMGAGPNRMNRAVVIRTTAGLAGYLADQGHRGEPVVVGYDARHRSADFAADAAAVLAAAGHPVWLADRALPTPVVAFGVRHLRCCAGVQITASHNPRADNGYKVYLADGAQIVPPADEEISARIEVVGDLASVAMASIDDRRITPTGAELVDAYISGVVELTESWSARADQTQRRELRVVYTPLHGVGLNVLAAVFERAGFAPPEVVPTQAAPDPDFPTLSFPNPEEPGALDRALELAHRHSADLVLANDPDVDRLAVAVPTRAGWRPLSGDEIGILLADWLLSHGQGPHRLVVTTVVSSSMLGRLARARGVAFAETLTGFKWIVRAGEGWPDLRFVYGYEEALGSCVGTLVRDKDGISAALAFAELAALEKARGRSVLDRLDDLARELGVHTTAQLSVPIDGPDGRERVRSVIDALATSGAPAALAGRPVTEVEDLRRGELLPSTEGVVLRGEGVRLVVRPSGTEPKLKCYAEAVIPVGPDDDLYAVRRQGEAMVDAILGGTSFWQR
jgi:phosphomannomutase